MSSEYFPPVTRPLKIYAFDPMLGRMPLHRISIDVLNEPLEPGPRGSRVEVLDYDGVADCFYKPVDLDDPAVLMQGGLDPSEGDPRFHQQMVFAVTMKVIENFELGLGRRFNFRGRRRLKIFPHAFRGANAFYDPRRHSLFFGYFPADMERPGANIPGQTIFSCLSHDIVAHEMTHAVVFRLRRYFGEASNPDVLAFHEGFADIVAIFQHFSFPAILQDVVRTTRGDLRENTPLVKLAEQFGYATGKGTALRSAIDDPDPSRMRKDLECHRRGSLLVAAVFEAFFKTYQSRIQDLLRIATGGTGRLPDGDMHPDLVERIAREATSTASTTLRMCIRAFDYLPPVDVTFGDFLRAMVTADFELNPSDALGLRRNVIEAFRVRGIYPTDVDSLSDGAIRWERYVADPGADVLIPPKPNQELQRAFMVEASETSRNTVFDSIPKEGRELLDENDSDLSRSFIEIHRWANSKSVRKILCLNPNEKIEVGGVHPSFRTAQDGQLIVETVIQFIQTSKASRERIEFGGVPLRGGTTVIARSNGQIQYIISKPLPNDELEVRAKERATRRESDQLKFAADLDGMDFFSMWQNETYQRDRIFKRATVAAQDWRTVR